ncbi:3'-5' RNA helicase ythdc2 [Homalodisca vitripennis]|nr:3'-5' RNA helicase ythdc2 [Homalodisca vitripennis]
MVKGLNRAVTVYKRDGSTIIQADAMIHMKGLNRAVTVYKRDGSTIIQADAVIPLVRPSRQAILTLLASHPVTNKERQDLLPITERDRSFPPEASCEFSL